MFEVVKSVVRRGGWLGLTRGNGVVAAVKEWRFQRVKWRLTAPGGSESGGGSEEKVGSGGREGEMKTTTLVAIHRMQRLYVIEVTRYLKLLGEYGSQVHEFSLARSMESLLGEIGPLSSLLLSSPVRSAVWGPGKLPAIAECAWNATASWSCCHLEALHTVRKRSHCANAITRFTTLLLSTIERHGISGHSPKGHGP
jgi:hypothetical protein